MTTVDGSLLDDLLPQLRGSRILLVTDRPAESAVQNVLRPSDYACVTEPAGPTDPDALLERLRPDLVVLDLASAGREGLALLGELHAAASRRPFLPILVTGNAATDSRAEVLAAGADDVATEPLVAEEFLARVRNLLALRTLLRRQRDLSQQAEMPAPRVAGAQETFLEAMVARVDQAVLACDVDGRIRFTNDAANRLGLGTLLPGRQPALAPGRLRSPEGRELAVEEDPLHRAWSGEDVVDQVIVVGSPQHGTRIMLSNAHPVRSRTDRPLGAVISLHDITEQHRITEELRRGLLEDELTGLPNMLLFIDLASRAIARTARDHQPLSFIVITLDGVDEVGDHDVAGGPLPFAPTLAALGRRLPRLLRPGDVAARHGDGFVLLCTAPVFDSQARHIVQRLQVGLSRPREVSRRRITPHLRFGIATTYDTNRPARTLIEIAEVDARRSQSRTLTGGAAEVPVREGNNTGW